MKKIAQAVATDQPVENEAVINRQKITDLLSSGKEIDSLKVEEKSDGTTTVQMTLVPPGIMRQAPQEQKVLQMPTAPEQAAPIAAHKVKPITKEAAAKLSKVYPKEFLDAMGI